MCKSKVVAVVVQGKVADFSSNLAHLQHGSRPSLPCLGVGLGDNAREEREECPSRLPRCRPEALKTRLEQEDSLHIPNKVIGFWNLERLVQGSVYL